MLSIVTKTWCGATTAAPPTAATGQSRRIADVRGESADPSTPVVSLHRGERRNGPKSCLMHRSKEHLYSITSSGAREPGRHFEPQRLRTADIVHFPRMGANSPSLPRRPDVLRAARSSLKLDVVVVVL